MEYSLEFKTKAFIVSRFSQFSLPLMAAIKEKKHNRVRLILEDLVDDSTLYTTYSVGEELKKRVKKDKQYTYNDRLDLYSTFMDKYIIHLDDVGVLQES